MEGSFLISPEVQINDDNVWFAELFLTCIKEL